MVKKKHLVVKSLLLQYPGFDIPCIFWSFQDLSRAYGEDNDFAGSPYITQKVSVKFDANKNKLR